MVATLRRPDNGGFQDDNFVVTATDPAGPWSDPYLLVDTPGIIDPSLFFDDDGRACYTANMRISDPPYAGYRDIWIQELDLERTELKGDRTSTSSSDNAADFDYFEYAAQS